MIEWPYIQHYGYCVTDNYYLVHSIWHCSDGSKLPETIVRRLKEDRMIDFDSAEKIVHNWTDFAAAERLILTLKNKGWDGTRITKLMHYISARKKRRH